MRLGFGIGLNRLAILSGGAFSPLTLFANGQEGAIWPAYTPSALFTTDTGDTLATVTDGVGRIEDVHLGQELGPELVTNGDFDTDSDWTKGTGWTISGGTASSDGTQTSSSLLTQSTTLSAGKSYKVSFDVTSYSAGSIGLNVAGTGVVEISSIRETGSFEGVATVGSGNPDLQLIANGNFAGSIDNISVKELPGNHLTQSSAALRGSLGRVPKGGRRNLLTQTEELDGAAWTKVEATVETTSIANPRGGLMQRFAPSINASSHYITNTTSSSIQPDGSTGTIVVKVEGDVDKITLYPGSSAAFVHFKMDTLTTTTEAEVDDASIEDLGDGFYLLTAVWPSSFTTDRLRIYASSGTLGSSGVAGDGTGILIGSAQLEAGSSATNYQRVGASDLDVTEEGVTSHRYVAMDLTDDEYSTTLPDGLTGQVLVAGRGGQRVTDVTVSSGGTFTIGPTSWTDGPTDALLAVTGDSLTRPGLIGATLREGNFTEAEKTTLVSFYKRKGAGDLII